MLCVVGGPLLNLWTQHESKKNPNHYMSHHLVTVLKVAQNHARRLQFDVKRNAWANTSSALNEERRKGAEGLS